jgi:hypothetical protein
VRQCLVEIIELADQDALDILRSRVVEQEVLDLIFALDLEVEEQQDTLRSLG